MRELCKCGITRLRGHARDEIRQYAHVHAVRDRVECGCAHAVVGRESHYIGIDHTAFTQQRDDRLIGLGRALEHRVRRHPMPLADMMRDGIRRQKGVVLCALGARDAVLRPRVPEVRFGGEVPAVVALRMMPVARRDNHVVAFGMRAQERGHSGCHGIPAGDCQRAALGEIVLHVDDE